MTPSIGASTIPTRRQRTSPSAVIIISAFQAERGFQTDTSHFSLKIGNTLFIQDYTKLILYRCDIEKWINIILKYSL